MLCLSLVKSLPIIHALLVTHSKGGVEEMTSLSTRGGQRHLRKKLKIFWLFNSPWPVSVKNWFFSLRNRFFEYFWFKNRIFPVKSLHIIHVLLVIHSRGGGVDGMKSLSTRGGQRHLRKKLQIFRLFNSPGPVLVKNWFFSLRIRFFDYFCVKNSPSADYLLGKACRFVS